MVTPKVYIRYQNIDPRIIQYCKCIYIPMINIGNIAAHLQVPLRRAHISIGQEVCIIHYIINFLTAMSTCAPFLQEKCLMAPVVSSKTVKILNAAAIARAIQNNPNIHFIHSVSDANIQFDPFSLHWGCSPSTTA